MARQYFGTDGIRGKVGQAPMTPDFLLKLGWAAGRVLAPNGTGNGADKTKERAKVLIGKDTRLSGYMFESALEAGFSAAGVDVLLVGPMPTPAIAYLTRTFRAAAGVVISASHNPYYDNGVKFFSAEGRKLPDGIEADIEAQLALELDCVSSAELGRARRLESASGRYVEFCKSTFRSSVASLKGLKLVVDCAHGASYQTAPHVFEELGAHVEVIGNKPNGLNINKECGSTHLEGLRAKVLECGADAGIALDGDGDRCMMITAGGEVIDGDQILYIIARDRQAEGGLNSPVVGTLMSNLGLALAFKAAGIEFERAKVGDRYVFERLNQIGGNLGGESSGHILCLDRATTGDGIVAALQVLAAMVGADKTLDELVADVQKCPQVMINVKIDNTSAGALMEAPTVQASVQAAEQALGEQGRVLLRPSGTEPLIRVMVEGTNEAQIQAAAERIAGAVRAAL